MAVSTTPAVNGFADNHEHSAATPGLLGKRKRADSPDRPDHRHSDGRNAEVRRNIGEILLKLQANNMSTLLLRLTLPDRAPTAPTDKKVRTEETNTIESRVASDMYLSVADFLHDLRLADAMVRRNEAQVNGSVNGDGPRATIDRVLEQYRDDSESKSPLPNVDPGKRAAQVLSVRSFVDNNLPPKQLFTGLRNQEEETGTQADIDAKLLPNGFEVVEASTLDNRKALNEKDSRTFGEVFRQLRNVRTLEKPRSSRGTRSNKLEFVEVFDNISAFNKNDYRYTSLDSGTWLNYSTPGQDAGARQRNTPTPQSNPENKLRALFKASYSSFAPSCDNSAATISESDRSRVYWKKYGRFSDLPFKPDAIVQQPEDLIEEETPEDGFPDYVMNYGSEGGAATNHRGSVTNDERSQVDTILEEVSDLLQTVYSYQLIRGLDPNQAPDSQARLRQPDLDTQEVLKSQLKVLIEGLPPFAVAKLNSDQLSALDINTSMAVSAPEFGGTGMPDEYTLRHNRAAHAATSAVGRNVPMAQAAIRTYPAAGPSPTPYNNQNRSYNPISQTPTAPNYAPRPPTNMYNTPRPTMTAPQTSFGQNQPYRSNPFPNATIQQYQRAIQNGFNPNAAMHTPYGARASPPVYQTQTPNVNVGYGRSASPQKPMVNGQVHAPAYPQRQYPTQQNHPVNSNNALPQRDAMDRIKVYQDQLRQMSGTPQPASLPSPNTNPDVRSNGSQPPASSVPPQTPSVKS